MNEYIYVNKFVYVYTLSFQIVVKKKYEKKRRTSTLGLKEEKNIAQGRNKFEFMNLYFVAL